jgi:TPP-dependent pyruvate/acetoin dehydrogenase alpha subunit
MGDFGYRTKEEVEEWKQRCPLARFRKYLIEKDIVPEAELSALDTEIEEAVNEAHLRAEQSP